MPWRRVQRRAPRRDHRQAPGAEGIQPDEDVAMPLPPRSRLACPRCGGRLRPAPWGEEDSDLACWPCGWRGPQAAAWPYLRHLPEAYRGQTGSISVVRCLCGSPRPGVCRCGAPAPLRPGVHLHAEGLRGLRQRPNRGTLGAPSLPALPTGAPAGQAAA